MKIEAYKNSIHFQDIYSSWEHSSPYVFKGFGHYTPKWHISGWRLTNA